MSRHNRRRIARFLLPIITLCIGFASSIGVMTAEARVHFGIGIGIFPPPYGTYLYGPPVVYSSPPFYYPPPVTYSSPPFYYPPPVVYASPPPSPPVVYASPPTAVPSSRTLDNRICREYQSSQMIGGRSQLVYGTACLQGDGSWRIVN